MNIAIDLGGTKIRAGLVENNTVVDVIYEKCQSDGSEKEVIDQICSMIDTLMSEEVKAIGIGVPSVVDPEEGIVYNTIGIPSWKEVHLKKILSEKYGKPVFVDNDCNCFAMGAMELKDIAGSSNVVCITLGTGVGSGIVIDGKLYRGENTGAGEIGSIPYLDKDYEFYCSSRFFEMHGTTGYNAEWDAVDNRGAAVSLWKEFGMHLGKLIKVILLTYDPGVIVIGGSISRAYEFFRDSMYDEIRTFQYSSSLDNLHIVHCPHDFVSLIGASAICNPTARYEE